MGTQLVGVADGVARLYRFAEGVSFAQVDELGAERDDVAGVQDLRRVRQAVAQPWLRASPLPSGNLV